MAMLEPEILDLLANGSHNSAYQIYGLFFQWFSILLLFFIFLTMNKHEYLHKLTTLPIMIE